jgi:adenylylsulfate kinase
MKQIILIMGLPGAGKTTLAQHLVQSLKKHSKVKWLNADEVRKKANDWDFSIEGRLRQAVRMRHLAEKAKADFVVIDMVAPLKEMRHHISAEWLVWVDTIEQSRFEDTNKAFEPPHEYDFRVTEQDSTLWSKIIEYHIVADERRPVFDWKKETVQMLGRWQPWHAGHRALFERAIQKTGQVVIQIRDCQGWNNSNPFAIKEVMERIRRDLDPYYQGMYEIQVVPNIVNITYGRDVGYKIEQEIFDEKTISISGTQIRKAMGLA